MKVSATALCICGVLVLNCLASLTAVGARQLPVQRVGEVDADRVIRHKEGAPYSRRSLQQSDVNITGAPVPAPATDAASAAPMPVPAASADATPESAPPGPLESVAQSPASASAPSPLQTLAPSPSRSNAPSQATAFMDGLRNCTETGFLSSSVNMTGTAQNCTVEHKSSAVVYVGYNNTAFQQACNASKGTPGPVDGNTTLMLCSVPVPASPPQSSGSSCSGGCIAGITIGAIAGVAVIAVLAFFAWRHFSNTSSYDGHTNVLSSWAPDTEPAVGAPVYCRRGSNSVEGRVSAWESDDTCRVAFADGSAGLVQRGCIAPRFNVGDEVIYTKEKGVAGVAATVESSHGELWPPFYRIRLFSGSPDSLNTTADHLQRTASKNVVV